MSKLNDMLQAMCSHGVDFKRFGDIAQISRGASPRPIKNFITADENGVNWIKIGDVAVGSKYITETNEKITQEGAKKSRMVHEGDFILSNSMSFGRPYIMKIDGCIHDGWLSISGFDKYMVPDFLYYVLISAEIQNEMKKRASFGGAVQNLNADIVRELLLPVPPLEIQHVIVAFLDKYTELSSELIKELTLEYESRKKQMAFYCNSLFTDNSKAKWVELSDIADIGTGSSNTKDAVENGEYPFYVRSQEPLRNNTFEYDETAIITAGDGVGVGKVFHFVEGKYALHQRAYRIHINTSDVLPKYCYYYMKNAFYDYITQNMYQGSVASIRRPMLNKFPIPIVSLEEQMLIIDTYDKFEELGNGILDELNKEIDFREKQYSYYRDLLLTFNKAV